MKTKILSMLVVMAVLLAVSPRAVMRAKAATVCEGRPNGIVIFPSIAHTSDGDSINLWGSGEADPFGRVIVRMGGEFTHFDPAGNLVRSGTWTAEKIIKFTDYGCDEDLEFDPGGRAFLRIRLTASDGSEATGILDIQSPHGDPPPDAIDGIRLFIKDWNLNFDQPVDHRYSVFFIAF